ncbi:ATP-binding cassette sub-family G member 4 [Musca domestica]|uniref:ATP-binding cassette sub-family G member 4 isoform X1 n=1 Tax=Musca domestica TaxID=7370 RepID=A0A1I8NE56_MUSDO|nr:ATP-binding cassette sub-family G member 4 [Musca domestica]
MTRKKNEINENVNNVAVELLTPSERESEIFRKIPPNAGVNIKFTNLSYEVPISKPILKNVSGEFRAGELSAIMGPSGCGKTTLLNLLAGYRLSKTSGNISVNDRPQNKSEFRKISRYILQEDAISPMFTIGETLLYASKFKLDAGKTLQQRQQIIDEYLKIFLLEDKANTKIANISGGERKRLCLALELLNNPAVLFVDEPTTGLDEFSATQCITLLKRLAISGRTIICSIHCPSARLFQMFDKVYVLSDGQCIYQGSVNGIVPYLKNFGLQCPITHNPADYIIEVATNFHGNYQEALVTEIQNGKVRKWLSNSSSVPNDTTSAVTTTNQMNLKVLRNKQHTWWSEYCIILKRNLQQMLRDTTNMKLIMYTNLFLSTILGIAFSKIGNNGYLGSYNYNFVVLSTVQCVFLSMSPMLSYVPQEILYLRREHFNQWYRLSTYFMALVSSQFVMWSFSTLLGSTIMYYLSNQPRQMFRYFLFAGITLLTSLNGSSYGILVGSRLRLLNALFMGPNMVAVWVMLSNYAVDRPTLHPVESFLMYSSFMRHSVEGLMETLFGFNRADLICPEKYLFCASVKPQFVMKLSGTSNANYLSSILFLLGFYIVFTLLAWLVLKCRFSSMEFLARNRFYRYLKYLQIRYLSVKAM